jgi:hypothetical protein
VIAFSAAG